MRSPEPRNGSVISLEALRCVTWPRNGDIVATVQLTYKVTVGTRECRSYWSITVYRYSWYSGLCGSDPLLRNHNWRTPKNIIYYQIKFVNYIYIYIYSNDHHEQHNLHIFRLWFRLNWKGGTSNLTIFKLLCVWWWVGYKYLNSMKKMSYLIIKRLLILSDKKCNQSNLANYFVNMPFWIVIWIFFNTG
jgi:hypothetical protein